MTQETLTLSVGQIYLQDNPLLETSEHGDDMPEVRDRRWAV
jgi:hypothetical protein